MADKSLSLVLGVGKFHECYFPQSNKLVKTKQKFYLLYSSSQKFSSVSSTFNSHYWPGMYVECQKDSASLINNLLMNSLKGQKAESDWWI